MKFKTYLTDSAVFLIILLSALIILSAPYFMRYLTDNSALMGMESYYHARLAEEIKQKGFITRDFMVYGSRPYHFNLYHLILAGASYAMDINFASKLLPFLFGMLSTLFFYLILNEFKADLSHRLVILLILVSSPVFIYTFTLSSPLAAIIFLDLLGFYLLLKQNRYLFILASIILASTLFFNLLNAAITLVLLLTFLIANLKKVDYGWGLFTILALVSIIFYAPFYLEYGLPQVPDFVHKNLIKSLVSDLGSNGLPLFSLLLATVGLIITWKNKYKYVVGYMLFLILIVLQSFFNTLIYLSFVISVLAGYTFIALFDMKWELRLVKKATILLLLLGMLLSTLSYLNRINDFPPNKSTIQSLVWLNENSGEKDVVLSHHSRGYWIETVSKRTAIMDDDFRYSDVNQRYADLNTTFYSRNLDQTKALLEKYNVKYVWIDRSMETGLVWTREDQGLLFLFRNNETFNNVYKSPEVQIWEVLKGENDRHS